MRGITKRYGDGFEAVSDVDLDIADGEFVILVGPSGCGKSTLLRMIVGLEDISDGEMRIGGEVVNGKALLLSGALAIAMFPPVSIIGPLFNIWLSLIHI